MTANGDDVSGVSKNESQTGADSAVQRCSCCWGKRLLIALAVFGVLSLLVALLLPARCVCREAARRMLCSNNLKQIGLAMHNYHEKFGCFPPAYVADAQGRPLHSWRVLVLPFLEGESLYRQISIDEPWDSVHNQDVFKKLPPPIVYHCPTAANPKDETCYAMIIGQHTISDGPHSVRLKDIKDGSTNTIMIAEIKDSGIPWYEPRDLNFKEMSFHINDPDNKGIGSYHLGHANTVFADGSARNVEEGTDPKLLKALITIDGGEDVSKFMEQ